MAIQLIQDGAARPLTFPTVDIRTWVGESFEICVSYVNKENGSFFSQHNVDSLDLIVSKLDDVEVSLILFFSWTKFYFVL